MPGPLTFVFGAAGRIRYGGREHGLLLLVILICLTHIFHRGLRASCDTTHLVPRMFNFAFCLQFPPRYNVLVKSFAEHVEKDLSTGGYFFGISPADANIEHTKNIVHITLLRPNRTRQGDDEAP